MGRAGPTTPTLVVPKILLFMVKASYFQSSGQTKNCQIEVLFKWSDRSCTPSAAVPEILASLPTQLRNRKTKDGRNPTEEDHVAWHRMRKLF